MKIIAGINVEYDHATCDTNGDGAVDSRDIVRLMKFISGQDVELFPLANTAVFYVKAGATDGDGTAATPYGTIAEAQHAIEQACEKGDIPEDYDINLIFLGGDYYQTSTLVLSSEKLGGRSRALCRCCRNEGKNYRRRGA